MLWSPDTCVCIVDYDVSNETIIMKVDVKMVFLRKR